MGTKDLPAAIDYVIEYTGQEKIAYLGYSEGTASMFTALSETDMQEKINVFIALAPIMTLKNVTDPFLLNLSQRGDQINYWANRFGIEELFGPNWSVLSGSFCFFNSDFCRTSATWLEM